VGKKEDTRTSSGRIHLVIRISVNYPKLEEGENRMGLLHCSTKVRLYQLKGKKDRLGTSAKGQISHRKVEAARRVVE